MTLSTSSRKLTERCRATQLDCTGAHEALAAGAIAEIDPRRHRCGMLQGLSRGMTSPPRRTRTDGQCVPYTSRQCSGSRRRCLTAAQSTRPTVRPASRRPDKVEANSPIHSEQLHRRVACATDKPGRNSALIRTADTHCSLSLTGNTTHTSLHASGYGNVARMPVRSSEARRGEEPCRTACKQIENDRSRSR